MEFPTPVRDFARTIAILAVVLSLAGCPAGQPPPRPKPVPRAVEPLAEPEPEPEPEAEMPPDAVPGQSGEVGDEFGTTEPAAPVDLGPPLVDNVEGLKRLDPAYPVWLDPSGKRVVMVGQVCQTEVPLEMFVCLKDTKEHESVLVVDTKAYIVHAALLALGAQPGRPVQFDPVYAPASGTEIEITVVWKDGQGAIQQARGQDWIRNAAKGEAMAQPWVFAGSGFWEDESAGQRHYQAEGGDFICVSNFSSAMLDLPIESSQAESDLMFEAFTERIPPLGTPVTVILAPKL